MRFGRALRILLGLSLLPVASAEALSIDGTGFSSTLIAQGPAAVALPILSFWGKVILVAALIAVGVVANLVAGRRGTKLR